MTNSDLTIKQGKDLLKALVSKGLLAQAQADLVEADCSATGMPVNEILIARGWVKEEFIEELMPIAAQSEDPVDKKKSKAVSGASYEENLKAYRNLLGEILGESSE